MMNALKEVQAHVHHTALFQESEPADNIDCAAHSPEANCSDTPYSRRQ